MPRFHRLLTVTTLLCALLVGNIATAQEATNAPTAPEWTEPQLAAMRMLMDMAVQLGSAAKFQVDLRVGYDAMQANGQQIEFGERRRISLERPSLLLSDEQRSDGSGAKTLFDGKWITVSETRENVYARAPQPGDIDQTVQYFVRDLGMRMPLAAMLTTRFPQELERRVVDINYVERTDILGEPTDHLAGRMKDIDFQVWISTDKRPVPLRIVITYRKEEGQPQFWANFSDWKFNPSFLHKTFRFEPSPDAREVPFVAQFTIGTESSTGSTAPSSTGEQP